MLKAPEPPNNLNLSKHRSIREARTLVLITLSSIVVLATELVPPLIRRSSIGPACARELVGTQQPQQGRTPFHTARNFPGLQRE